MTSDRQVRGSWAVLAPSASVLLFWAYFTWDLLTLRKAFLHPDLYTSYYSFRHWFTTALSGGRFPLWNPYWGIGQAAEVWATIPLDPYTLLEFVTGPQYHLFHALQALLLLGAALYGLIRLGFSPMLSAAGAILLFLTPFITYFYFYFIHTHSFVAHILLFTFMVLWFKTGQRRHLALITWTTIFSMLGTKLELWFFQTTYFVFLALAAGFVFGHGRLRHRLRLAAVPLAFMALGIAAHAWQLNILVRLLGESGRALQTGLGSLLSKEIYKHFILSLAESVFLKLALLAILLVLALRTRGVRAGGLAALAGVLGAAALYGEGLTFRADETLPNGSLESWTQRSERRAFPEHFSYEGSGAVKQVTGPGDVKSGRSAALIEAPAAGEARLRYTLPDVGTYRGRAVRLTLWSKGGDASRGLSRAIIDDGSGSPSVSKLPGGDHWAPTTIEHHVAAEATSLSLVIAVAAGSSSGLLVDDIGLKRSAGFIRASASRDGTLRGLFLRFLSSPVLVGALLGLALSMGLAGRVPWREYAIRSLLFFPFVYYYCRQAHGDLAEVHYVQLAPVSLQILLAAGVWLGCGLLRRDPLAQLAYASSCFVFVARDQGQILLAYLAGWLWIPTRDNYIIDFSFLLLALLGLAHLSTRPGSSRKTRPGGPRLAEGLAMVTVVAVLISTHSNLYYMHPLVANAPPGYPYFTGVANVRDLFRRLKEGPTTRAYLHNEPFMEFHHGAGASLLEGLAQVTSYASLNNSRYREWTTYHRLAIRPEEHWRGYANEYTPATIARLPHTNTLGHTNSQIYNNTLINRPPLDGNLLRILGVGRVLHLHFIAGPYTVDDRVPPLPSDVLARLQPARVRGISSPDGPTGAESMFVADLSTPLPRAFLVPTIPREHRPEFESELTPRWEAGVLRTASLRLSPAPAEITRYEPEHVSVAVSSREDAMLVLTDLYHPFWRVSVDGRPADLTPALFLFRGVDVPAGTHRVDFTCQIPAARSMLALSLLSALLSVTAFSMRGTPWGPTPTTE